MFEPFDLGSPFVIPSTRDVNKVVHENSDADSGSPFSTLYAVTLCSEADICSNVSAI